MKLLLPLTTVLLALPLVGNIVVPNPGFEDDNPPSTFSTPTGWSEDYDRGGDERFSNSGTVSLVSARGTDTVPHTGDVFARVAVNGDADPETTFFGSISPENSLGTLEADTLYTLNFFAARDDFVGNNEWFVWAGFRVGGTEVSEIDMDIRQLTDGSTTGQEDTWYPVSVTLDTQINPGIVGQDFNIFLGFRHRSNFNKTIYFDDVSVTSQVIPEPAAMAFLTGALFLALAIWRRRK